MKHNLILTGLLMVASTLCMQAQERATQYFVKPAITVHQPLQGDSINFTGKKRGISELMRSNVSLHFDAQNQQLITVDTAGYASLEKAEKEYTMYLLKTRLRAERFTKGALKVSSPVRFEVFINGISKRTKESCEESMDKVRPAAIPLTLDPEADQEIVIRLFTTPDDKLAPALKCEFQNDPKFKEVKVHIDPTMKRRYSLHNSAFAHRAISVSLSNDGRYLITGIQENFGLKNQRTHYELTEVKSGRMLNPDLSGEWRWMPRSSKLYRMKRGAKGNDLIIYDPATQQEETLARELPEGRYTWAPTEDYLIGSKTDEGEKVTGPLHLLLHPDDRIPGSRNRSHITRYDLATGVLEQLTYGSHGVYLNDISADGKKLLCSTSKSNITKCPFSLSSLFEIDLTTMKADTLVKWDAYLSHAAYSPDASQLIVIGTPSAFNGIGKNCGNLPIANDFDTQAFILDKATGAVDPITRDFNPAVKLVSWNPTNGLIYFNTTDEDCQHIYTYSPKSRKFEMLPLEEDVIGQFSLPDANPSVAAYIGGGSYSAGVAYTYDPKKKSSKLIAFPMKEMLDDIEMGQIEPWNFTAADGTLVKGLICLPPSFDENKKYPLIVYYYGGTTPTTKGIGSPYSPQVFASRDYVVYVVQPSGAIGYGQEYSARHVNAWGDYTADEIIEGVKKFCAAHPFVNDKRVGCIGASYGGFMTQYLQTKTDIFAAAVSHAGISNVTSYWGEGYWGYSYNAVAAAESYPWSNPDLFTKHGSLFNADKIHTPLLLLHGTADTNVPTGESIQLYNALKILDRPVELILVSGENHFISDYPKRELWHKATMAWFARYLQDSPEWWNELYPERHW